MVFIKIFFRWLCQLILQLTGNQLPHRFRHLLPNPRLKKPSFRYRPKPAWVGKEVIRLAALMPGAGCRRVAATFNRLHGERRSVTVSKSYVYGVIKKHQYEIRVLRRRVKHRVPRPLPRNTVWSLDLTQVRDQGGNAHTLFGLIDNGTRACLTLSALANKASITLLRLLLDAIDTCGKPNTVRTDNEAVFVSKLFRLGLWWLGIKHQRTEKGCPWMNGRVERLFGTLKERLRYHVIESAQSLVEDLHTFRCWYNHVRPHQYLDSKTPAEAWHRQKPNTRGKHGYFYGWNGALTGFYLPPG